jgi:hypothetical protein
VKMDPVVKYLSHCSILFQLFGHQFFSVKTLSNENQKKFPSLTYTIYFVFVFIVLTSQMIIFSSFAAEEIHVELSAKTALTSAVQHSMYIGLILIICVSLTESFSSTPLIKKFFLNCLTVAKMCQDEFNKPIDHRRIRGNVLRHFLFIILFLVVSQNLLYIYEKYFNQPRAFFQTICAILPMTYLNTTGFKYVFYVKLVNFHLETIYEILPEMFNSPKSLENILIIKPQRTYKSTSFCIKIRNLRKMYNIVYENSQIINKAMGKTVLTIVTVMVIVITASGYRMFLTVVGKLPVEKLGGLCFKISMTDVFNEK